MNILKNIIIAVFLFSISINIEAANTENMAVKNEEEARLAYSLALYHRDLAISKFSNNEDGTYDIERSNNILKGILKFETIEEVYTTLSENYELLGDYKNSIKTYEDILKKDEYNVNALIKLAQKYFFILQDYDKSEYYTKKAFEIEPYNNNVLLLLGYINYDKYKNYVKSCYYFSKMDANKDVNSEFNLIDYNIYYGLSAFYNGMFSLAKERMLKVSKSEIESKNYLYNVITKSSQVLEDYKTAYKTALNVYENYGDEEALYYAAFLSVLSESYNEELFDRISKSRRKPPKIIDIALIANTDNVKAIVEIEKEFENENFDLDLIQLYYYLISKNSDKNTIIEAKKLVTDFYLSLGSYESVLIHLNDIAQESINSKDDINTVIAIYIKTIDGFYKNYDYINTKTTIEEYLKILKLYNITEDAYYTYVVKILYSINEYDLALSTINTLDKLSDNENKKYKYDSLKAYVYSLKGDKENTAKYMTNYLDYITGVLEYAAVLKDEDIIFDLNILYVAGFNIRDKQLIERTARLIYSLNTTSAQFINTLAWALIDLEINVDEGMKIEREAIKLDSKNIYYLDTIAWGHYKKGNYEEALKILMSVLFKMDDSNIEANIEILTHTADTYFALNNKDMALTYYLKARAYMFDTKNMYEEHVNNMIGSLKKW